MASVSVEPARRPARPRARTTPSRRPPVRVLLTSVFGPYARDDEYGGRRINPMELHHNQVTRVQGPFSLRMFHRSWGLMMIQSNLETPCTLLDFPDLDRFVAEIRDHEYEVVGISAIAPGVQKVAVMCALIRRHLPRATIVVGGHVTGIADLARRIDADHIVRGEGIRWFQEFLGEDATRPLRHAEITSAFGFRTMGIRLSDRPRATAATVIPSVGCPMGCNFCCTSAMFGGKGRHVPFFDSGDELYDLMEKLERSMGIQTYFVMDENFLLYRKRTLRLLELMERHGKAWSLSLFSSANAVRRYTMDEIVRLGVSWMWLGLEGEDSGYGKLAGADTKSLVRRLRSHGVKVLGSSIIGMEHHTPENIDAAIEHAVSHDTDLHQFMLYMPMPGTPLHADLSARGLLKDEGECAMADAHGQEKFNYRHPHIRDGSENELLLRAFRRDLEVNGPSVTRICRTLLDGWRRHGADRDPRVRRRFARECGDLPTVFAATVGGALGYYRNRPSIRERLERLRADLVSEFGWRARLWGAVGGKILSFTARREERRLARGWTCEPPSFHDVNEAAAALAGDRDGARLCRQVSVRTAPAVRAAREPEVVVPVPAG